MRHGYSMSLAPNSFDPVATFHDSFGSSNPETAVPPGLYYEEGIAAPQGHVPVVPASLVSPQEQSRPLNRPDFVRGFGLDIPEEEEEEEATVEEDTQGQVPQGGATQLDADISQDMELDESVEDREELLPLDGTATASQSRFHSRHVSKLSATLSIRSAGALEEDAFDVEDEDAAVIVDPGYKTGQEDMDLEDVVGEWTGSEDVHETSDREGVGILWASMFSCY